MTGHVDRMGEEKLTVNILLGDASAATSLPVLTGHQAGMSAVP